MKQSLTGVERKENAALRHGLQVHVTRLRVAEDHEINSRHVDAFAQHAAVRDEPPLVRGRAERCQGALALRGGVRTRHAGNLRARVGESRQSNALKVRGAPITSKEGKGRAAAAPALAVEHRRGGLRVLPQSRGLAIAVVHHYAELGILED